MRRSRRAKRLRPITQWDRRSLDVDHRGVQYQRYEAIRAGIISDLGGEDVVTTAETQIADRGAFLSMKLEMLQIADLSGEQIDMQWDGQS